MIPPTAPILVGPGLPLIEARATLPEDPGAGGYWGSAQRGALDYAWEILGYGEEWRDRHIDPQTAMAYSAVYGCIRAIAQPLASVGWHQYERRGDNNRYRFPVDDDISWLLNIQTNPEVNAFDFWQTLVKDALVCGNGYAEIERIGSGKPYWLWRIDPDRVTPERDSRRMLRYSVDNGPGEEPTYLPPENVFHLKNLSPDGLVGWSTIALARRAIQLGLAEEKFGVDFFDRGPQPGGTVEVPQTLTPEKRQELRRTFEAANSGAKNRGRVMVLYGGMKFSPFAIPQEDAQFLQSRTFQVQDLCRWFGVPPHKLADLSRSTYSNIEEEERAFVTDTLMPWACRLESEANVKLFGRTNRGKRFTRLNLDALQRGNSTTQTQTVVSKVTNGILSINEGREYFDLNPIEGGDTPLIQGAMITLDAAISPPEPPPPQAPPPPAGGDSPPPDNANANGKAPAKTPAAPDNRRKEAGRVFTALAADAYSRLLRVEEDKARRAEKRGNLSNHVVEYYHRMEAIHHVRDSLRPAIEAALLSLGKGAKAAHSLATAAALRHVEASRHALVAGHASPAWWAERPQKAAADDLAAILAFNEDQERDDHGNEKEQFALAQEQNAEDAKVEAEREKEDKEIAQSRQDEDDERVTQRDEEDTATEDARREEDDQIQSARDTEDAALQSKRDAEDADLAGRHERGEITDDKHDAEREKLDARREKEDDALQARREKEDDRLQTRRDKEDEKSVAKREKEDEKLQEKREAEDEARQEKRDAEDEAREAKHERQTEELEAAQARR